MGAQTILLRRDVISECQRMDPILAPGEPFVTLSDDERYVIGCKIGDGIHRWSDLPNIGQEYFEQVNARITINSNELNHRITFTTQQVNDRITNLEDRIIYIVKRAAVIAATAGVGTLLWLFATMK